MTTYEIYYLACNDENITEVYIGHTKNFNLRYNSHHSRCTYTDDPKYHLKVYEFIREHGGWENWRMETFDYVTGTEDEAKQREDYWMVEFKAELNTLRSSRNNHQRYLDNKEEHYKKTREWANNNRERVREISKKCAARITNCINCGKELKGGSLWKHKKYCPKNNSA